MAAVSPDAPTDHASTSARTRQLGPLLRSAHPRQALVFGIAVVAAAAFAGRNFGQAVVAGLAVLVVQLVAGLINDVSDVALDRAAEREDKPLSTGVVPVGNATFVATALFLLAVPLSLQSGVRAGLILLATLVVAFLHNRSLHRTPFSFVAWMVTVPMIAAFVSYADRNGDVVGTAPTTPMLLITAALGLCLHLITSLSDLPSDHSAGIRPLPLAIALKIGAPRLMYATIALSVISTVVLIIIALGPGLHR